MKATDEPPAIFRRAIALSIVAHLCALWLLAEFFGGRYVALSSEIETGSNVFITRLVRREPAPVRHPARVAFAASIRAAVAPPQPAARARSEPATAAVSRRPRVPGPAPARSSGAARQPAKSDAPPRPSFALVAMPSATPRSVVSAARPTSEPALLATAAPTPTPTPTPTPSATPAQVAAASFGGLFSQNYPPALASPGELAAVRAKAGGPARIRIDVDENGRATDVRFERPMSDPQLEAEIHAALLALRYVPADCNGLHCEGTLEIAW